MAALSEHDRQELRDLANMLHETADDSQNPKLQVQLHRLADNAAEAWLSAGA